MSALAEMSDDCVARATEGHPVAFCACSWCWELERRTTPNQQATPTP